MVRHLPFSQIRFQTLGYGNCQSWEDATPKTNSEREPAHWRSEMSAVNRALGQPGINVAMNQAICDVFSASESASEWVMKE
jgi:hypothetical protein